MRREDGSALMLMPAAVLVVLLLAAIAVDGAIAFLGERELADLTAAAANDAAVGALREEEFYRCGALVLDAGRAEDIARTVVAARSRDAVTITAIRATLGRAEGVPTVEVRATGTVDLIFSPTVPGVSGTRRVSAVSVAEARPLGPGGQAPPASC